MGQLLRIRNRLTPGNLDDLLARLAKEHQMLPRITAVADTDYPIGSEVHSYLTGYYDEVQSLNEDLADFLEQLQDSWDATSTSGKLSYKEKVRRRDRLNTEIAEYEAQMQTNITPFRGR